MFYCMLLPSKNEIRKPTKTLSGVTPIAVMIKPRPCKHGVCRYCPSLNVPQSYTPKSPPVIRAKLLKYNPYEQVISRLKAFKLMNHPTDKIELIIMGGTFLSYPIKYQTNFIKQCYDALNEKPSKTLEKEVEIEWSKEIGGEGYHPNKILIGKGGSLYIRGITSDSGKLKSFLMKLDKNKELSWIKEYDVSGRKGNVAIDNKDNIYASENGLITKYNSNGEKLWERKVESWQEGISQSNFTIDNSGHICILGLLGRDPALKKYNELLGWDSVIEKYSDNGEKILSGRDYVLSRNGCYKAIITDEENNIYLTGFKCGYSVNTNVFVAKYSKDGKEVWTNYFGINIVNSPRDIKIDKEGGLYIIGETAKEKGRNQVERDAFLTKLNKKGEVLWSREAGTKDADTGIESIIDKEHNIYFIGRTYLTKPIESFIIKYNKEGDKVWRKNFKIKSNPYIDASGPLSIALEGDTSFYVISGAISDQSNDKMVLTKFKQK